MTTQELIEGLEILDNCMAAKKGCNIYIHDVVLRHMVTDTPLADVDITRMLELGFVQPDIVRMEADDYDPEKEWYAYL